VVFLFETQFETQNKFDTQTFIFEFYPLKVAGKIEIANFEPE